MMEDDSVAIKKIQKITGGAIRALAFGYPYVAAFSKENPAKSLESIVCRDKTNLSGSGFDSELPYVDSPSKSPTAETVTKITNLLHNGY
ncbi:hypothetical protein [Staphylococcus phage vB_SauH_DELF3]|nr:hypothetical protein [Staphylococcus phage vB_SauH_DELF3]